MVVRELQARGAVAVGSIYWEAAVEKRDGRGATTLFIAIEKGHLEVVRELLARGAAVDAQTLVGATPLFIASERGHLEVVIELLARGAAVDSFLKPSVAYGVMGMGKEPWTVGATPLYAASPFGYVRVVRALLLRGAAVDKVSSSGDTPLSRAMLENRGDTESLLRAAGATNYWEKVGVCV